MATYRVKNRGQDYTVTVVDNATGGGTVTIDDQSFEVVLTEGESGPAAATPVPGAPNTPLAPVATPPAVSAALAAPIGAGSIVAPIPGKVVSIQVKVGDSVSANQIVLKLEAMKMENDIVSPVAGTVQEIAIAEGGEASAGQLLMVVG